MYFVDEHGLDTFGLNLLAGENFRLMKLSGENALTLNGQPMR